MEVEGALGVALMDLRSGMCLGSQASTTLDVQLAATQNIEVVRAKQALRDQLGLSDEIEDILISLETQDHLIRPSAINENLFFYYMMKGNGNLPRARMTLRRIDAELEAVLDDLPLPETAAEQSDVGHDDLEHPFLDPHDLALFQTSVPSGGEKLSGDALPVEGDFLLELGMSGLGI